MRGKGKTAPTQAITGTTDDVKQHAAQIKIPTNASEKKSTKNRNYSKPASYPWPSHILSSHQFRTAVPFLLGIPAYHSGISFALGIAFRRNSLIALSSSSASRRCCSSFSLCISSSLRLTSPSNFSLSLARCSVQKKNGTTGILGTTPSL